MKPIAEMEESITVRMLLGAGLGLERAAIGVHARPAQFARRILLDGLRANGFELASADEGTPNHADW
jgi:hypothetical protein